jgi:predicted Zn-dependent protease
MRRTLCAVVITMASIGLFAEGQRAIYDSAVKQYDAKQYEEACSSFKQLYETSNRFLELDSSIIATEKSSLIRGFDWQNKAFLSQNAKNWAKECSEWYRGAVRQRAADNDQLVKSDVEAAQKAVKNLEEQKVGTRGHAAR